MLRARQTQDIQRLVSPGVVVLTPAGRECIVLAPRHDTPSDKVRVEDLATGRIYRARPESLQTLLRYGATETTLHDLARVLGSIGVRHEKPAQRHARHGGPVWTMDAWLSTKERAALVPVWRQGWEGLVTSNVVTSR